MLRQRAAARLRDLQRPIRQRPVLARPRPGFHPGLPDRHGHPHPRLPAQGQVLQGMLL